MTDALILLGIIGGTILVTVLWKKYCEAAWMRLGVRLGIIEDGDD